MAQDDGERPDRVRWGFGSILAWATWLGLISGALELAVFLFKCNVVDPRNYNVGRHMPWMFAAAGWAVVGSAGLALAVGSRFWPRLGRPRVALGVLIFFAIIGLLFRVPIYTLACLLLAGVLAWRGSGPLAPIAIRLDRSAGRGVVVPIALFGAVVGTCYGLDAWREGKARSEAVAARPSTNGRNVILLVLDTVRAESLGLYGYAKPTSPNLERIAREGVRFDRAFSTAPWTAPSHASMFTGRWPHELSVGWETPLDRTHATLAESLASRGYSTAGFVANVNYCSAEVGLDRGFAHYEDYVVTPRSVLLCSALVQRAFGFASKHPGLDRLFGEDGRERGDRKDAATIGRDFLGWLDGRSEAEADRPFFAFLNYYDAHHPYVSPDLDEGPSPFGRSPRDSGDFRTLKHWWGLDKRTVDPDKVELVRDSYDRCIAYLDGQIGRLWEELGRRGLLENSLVIITADHGEHLGEHRLFGHGCSVYQPELHVPLLMVAPGAFPRGRSVDGPVSLRDLPATVWDVLGCGPGSPFPGRSLRPGSDRGLGLGSGLVLSEVESTPDDDPNRGASPSAKGPLRSVVEGDWHYIGRPDGGEELYDQRRDPGESVDLAGLPDSSGTLSRLRSRLAEGSGLGIGPGYGLRAERGGLRSGLDVPRAGTPGPNVAR